MVVLPGGNLGVAAAHLPCFTYGARSRIVIYCLVGVHASMEKMADTVKPSSSHKPRRAADTQKAHEA